MRSSFTKINQFTPLITDTLPYEVPFLFSNRGFYNNLKKEYDEYFNDICKEKASGKNNLEYEKDIKTFFVDYFLKKSNSTQFIDKVSKLCEKDWIPFEYEIKKNNDDFRTISLIHPLAQLDVCTFYKKYAEVILFYCNKSLYSLRHPEKLTSRLLIKNISLVDKIMKDEEQTQISDIKEKVIEDHESVSDVDVQNSYFVFKKYRFIHDFYDSYEYLSLEKRYRYCFKFDIKQCFSSIYSHSISWAVKGKDYSKKYLRSKIEGFESEFDHLMQRSNYGETHGIPIGGEVSRIFSEVILQHIDCSIQQKFAKKNRVNSLTNDLIIKRYIDDYFVFANDKEILDLVFLEFSQELKKFKLFINESKTNLLSRPFITPITSSKNKIAELLGILLRSHHEIEITGAIKEVFKSRISQKRFLKCLSQIRSIVVDQCINFGDISNILLGMIKKDLLKNLSKLKELESIALKEKFSNITAYIKNIIFLSFYIFSLSPRSHTCASLFKITFIIEEFLKTIDDKVISGEVHQELFSQCILFFESLDNSSLIEFLDLFLIIENLGGDYHIAPSRLKKMVKIHEKHHFTYFEIMTLLAYIQTNPIYSDIRILLIKKILNKLKKDPDFQNSETFLLFFDALSCPYIDKADKRKFLESCGITKNKDKFLQFIKGKIWFFDWEIQKKLDLKSVMSIKESVNNY